MTDETVYTPPKIWTWNKENGGQFANINRPVAGPTHEKDLPVGRRLTRFGLVSPNSPTQQPSTERRADSSGDQHSE